MSEINVKDMNLKDWYKIRGDLERRFENTVWEFGNIKRIDKDIICVEYGKYNKGNFTFYITTLKLYYSTKKEGDVDELIKMKEILTKWVIDNFNFKQGKD